MKNQEDTRQLQFWDAKARQYAPSAHQGDLDPDNARVAACGRPWRIAKAERPLKPKHNPPRNSGSAYSIEDKQIAYLAWAQLHKLPSVTMYTGTDRKLFSNPAFKKHQYWGKINYVDPDEYFAVEETEYCEYLEAA
jgi:hypothetical protein